MGIRGGGWNLRSGALGSFCFALLLALIAAAPASAGKLSVSIAGSGAGALQSQPAGINCDNSADPGGPGTGECVKDFGFVEQNLELTATPSTAAYVFAGWAGTGAAACNSGFQNPCSFKLGAFEQAATVTATFAPKPDPAIATTTGSSAGGAFYLAQLEGTVNPNGSVVIGCRFDYGPTDAYGNSVACSQKPSDLGAGNEPVAVSAETEPLEPDSTYHFRLVITNLAGGSEGGDQSLTAAPAPADSCANADRRAEQGVVALALPACMALELVSPTQKNSQPAKTPSLTPDGGRVTFRSTAALGDTPGVLNIAGDRYVATRGLAGWETQATAPPAQFPRGWDKFPVPVSFNPDFSSWFYVLSTTQQFESGVAQAYRGRLGSAPEPISPLLAPPIGFEDPDAAENIEFEAASADHTRFYFNVPIAAVTYVDGDPVPAGAAADRNVYVAKLDGSGQPALELLARDGSGNVWGGRCGARIGGNRAENGQINRNQGVVSVDGSRTYFSTRADQPESGYCNSANRLRILVREETESGPVIAPLFTSECTRTVPTPCSTEDGDDRFQGASVDGTKVYFATTRQLVNSDSDATVDLYLYNADAPETEKLTQVSAGDETDATPGANANVQGNVVALSTDGSHVYFVATDVLTTDANPSGATAAAGQMNLYAYRAGSSAATLFVGTLDGVDSAFLWGSSGGFQNQAYPVPAVGQDLAGTEVGGQGDTLLFISKASLTAADADGGRNDVFRFRSSGSPALQCISCKPGAPDAEPFDVAGRNPIEPLGTDFAEKERWVSEDGETVALRTAQPLVPGDQNGVIDSYVWRQGELLRLPGRAFAAIPNGERTETSLSHSGHVIAFQTGVPLLAADGDNSPDIYVARIGGGFIGEASADPCSGEACQAAAAGPPADAPIRVAPPEPPPPVKPPCRKGTVKRNGKCVKRPCRKGAVRRNGKCVNKKESRVKKKGNRQSAGGDRGAAK